MAVTFPLESFVPSTESDAPTVTIEDVTEVPGPEEYFVLLVSVTVTVVPDRVVKVNVLPEIAFTVPWVIGSSTSTVVASSVV